MTMESLGQILRRINAASIGKTTNGAGAHPAPPPAAADRCPACHGRGWVTRRLPVDHPKFGQAAPCPDCRGDADSPARLDALRRYSNLGGLSRATFAAASPHGPLPDPAARRMFAAAQEAAAAYAENPQGWLVFTGPSGSGKTWLAAAIANRCIQRQQTAFFTMVADLLDHLRAAYAPESPIHYDELFDQVRNVPLLILDDLGVHSATPWAQEKLFQVINHRYNNLLPTVITVRGPLHRLDETLRTRLEPADGRCALYQLGQFTNRLTPGIGEVSPEMLGQMTFATFNPAGGQKATSADRKDLEKAFDAAKSFAQYGMLIETDPDGWLLLMGTRGSGKTHLAVAIANQFLQQNKQVFFAFVPTLLDHLRKTYGPDSAVAFDELFDQVVNAPILILDDLGAENSTPWAEEKLYQIIVHRHQTRMPTVITTASTMDDLEKSRPGIASRLVDRGVVECATIDAPNYRAHPRP